MKRIEQTLEMRGMPRKELVNYFIELGGHSVNGLHFIGDTWEVFIFPESSCAIGSITFPSTKVKFILEEEIFHEMILKFRMRFLCAGG